MQVDDEAGLSFRCPDRRYFAVHYGNQMFPHSSDIVCAGLLQTASKRCWSSKGSPCQRKDAMFLCSLPLS